MTVKLLSGADAITEAAVAAGCRFFAGYPMLPFTGVLEGMAREFDSIDGAVCMNAASEIEAVNMTLGAAAAGARAATGSCGQGVALMQEAIAEAAQAEIPFVIFTMGRGQQDYFQCTRGAGWGDYRTLTLAPKDVNEAVQHTQLAFHLADAYRCPTIVYGDYLIADTMMSVEVDPIDFGELPAKDWAVDGTRGGKGKGKMIWAWGIGKTNDPGPQPDGQWKMIAAKYEQMAETEARHESYRCDDAEVVVVSWGTSSPFVDHVVDELRAEGHKVGSFRPVTLWPFPEDALREATKQAERVLVYEINAGKCIDDVRISVDDHRRKVRFIGGVSIDYSGMRQGELLHVAPLRQRIRAELDQLAEEAT